MAAEIGSMPFFFGVDDGEEAGEEDWVGVRGGGYWGVFWYWG